MSKENPGSPEGAFRSVDLYRDDFANDGVWADICEQAGVPADTDKIHLIALPVSEDK